MLAKRAADRALDDVLADFLTAMPSATSTMARLAGAHNSSPAYS
jgi:hypothetical protein